MLLHNAQLSRNGLVSLRITPHPRQEQVLRSQWDLAEPLEPVGICVNVLLSLDHCCSDYCHVQWRKPLSLARNGSGSGILIPGLVTLVRNPEHPSWPPASASCNCTECWAGRCRDVANSSSSCFWKKMLAFTCLQSKSLSSDLTLCLVSRNNWVSPCCLPADLWPLWERWLSCYSHIAVVERET